MDASRPTFPEGVKPSPPMSPADKSERMSPYLQDSQLDTRDWVGGRDRQVWHDHDVLLKWRGIRSDSQADPVQQVLRVLDLRVLLRDRPTSTQEHAVAHLPIVATHQPLSLSTGSHIHDWRLMHRRNLPSPILRSIMESISSNPLRSVVRDELYTLHNTIHDLMLDPRVLPLCILPDQNLSHLLSAFLLPGPGFKP